MADPINYKQKYGRHVAESATARIGKRSPQKPPSINMRRGGNEVNLNIRAPGATAARQSRAK